MKTLKLVACLAVALSLAGGSQAKAATGTADAKAEIVVAISILKTHDLDFGQVVAGSSDGTVVMSPSGTRTPSGGAELGNAGTAGAASFTVTGAANATYSIGLPSSAVILDDGASHTMTLDTFTSDPTPTGLLDGSGTQTLNVGGTLHVLALQAAGTYSHLFDVTVAYN